MSIPFTQYLLPNGQRRAQQIDRPADIESLAEKFIASGGRYECEVLTTGHVSFTAVNVMVGQFKWPRHAASLHLTHNQHKAYYQTVAQSIEQDDHGYQADCWVSKEQKAKAIATNECWTLQWYPNTPVGFFHAYPLDTHRNNV